MLVRSNEFELLTQNILKQLVARGATDAAVSIGFNKGFTVTAREGAVETVAYNQDKSMDIAVLFGQRSGSASVSDFSKHAIDAAIDAACHIAKFTDNDPMAGLADQSELAFHYPDLDLFYPWALTVEEAIELAIQCEREALQFDKRIMCAEDTNVATEQGLHYYANSLGFVGWFPYTRHDISCALVASVGDEKQRDYDYTISIDPNRLRSVSEIAKGAAERTVKRLGARRLNTCKAPVIFIAEEARGLLGHFLSAISGGALYRHASFLKDHLNKKIFPEFITLQENPHLPTALGSAPFDGDGVLTRPNVFIQNGVLQNYILNVYTARQLGLKTTGNAGGVHNLTISTSDQNLASLLKTMQRGLLVTEVMGNGINLVTGDYSRGVNGFWVEHGEIQFPVQEVTIAGNLRDIFMQFVCVGNDVDLRGNIRTGSILVEQMMIAGE